MSYQDLLNSNTKPTNFYQQLIDHTSELLQDIENRNQGVVAKDLGMSQTQLSHILKLLKELFYAKQH